MKYFTSLLDFQDMVRFIYWHKCEDADDIKIKH